jgi:hypothetical protein
MRTIIRQNRPLNSALIVVCLAIAACCCFEGVAYVNKADYPVALRSIAPPISFEMASRTPENLSPRQRVQWWLHAERDTIRRDAERWQVSPTAIAGVVAYEALENREPAMISILARYSGPGKVHYRESRLSPGDPVSKQVEDTGYVPKRSWQERRRILSTNEGAISYIAAIMRAFSDLARYHGRLIQCDSAVLSTLYTAWDLHSFSRRLNSNDRSLRINEAGRWVANNRNWLEVDFSSQPPRGYKCSR